MSIAQIKKGNFRSLLIPAPKGLSKTSVSPQALGTQYARYLENMLPDTGAANALAKRNGFGTLGDAIGAGNITELMDYRKSDGTNEILAYTDDGKIHVLDESAGTWSTLKSGLNTDGTVRWTIFNDVLVIVNGIDNNMEYDGSTISDMSEYVRENLGVDWADENQVTVPTAIDHTSRYPAARNVRIRFKGKDIAITSITRASSTATVTTTQNHNLATGTYVTISNAAQDEYNGRFEITSTGANTFTYTVSGTPATPATVNTARIKSVKGTVKPTTEETQLGKVDGKYKTSENATGFRVYFQTVAQFTDPRAQLGNVKVQFRSLPSGAWQEAEPHIRKANEFHQLRAEVENLTQGQYEIRVIESGAYTYHTSDLTTGEKNRLGLLNDQSQPVPFEREYENVTLAVYEKAFQGNVVESTGLSTATEDNIVEVSSITHTGGTATVTTVSNHPYQTGDFVTIFDAAQSEYNSTWEITRASATTFTFAITGNPTTPATVAGYVPTTLVYAFDEVEKSTTVDSSSYSSGNQELTITFAADVLPDTGDTIEITDLEYETKARPFGFIFTQHDRLWALEGGELKATTFKTDNRTKVYYTGIRNARNTWFNEDTQAENFIDVSRKFQGNEELVGIAALDDSMVFFGRRQLQIWSGSNPTYGGDFVWAKSIPVGCVHGSLIQSFPRDVLFCTEYGARSLRNVFQTENLEIQADLGSNVDPTVQEKIRRLKASDAAYKKARSWFYDVDGFYGFRLDDNGPLVYALSEEARGWTIFTGLFKDATAYLGLNDGRLVIAKNDQLYVYENAANGTPSYDDNGSAYRAAWWTPWIELRGRYKNNYIEVLFENSGANLSFTVRRFKDQNQFASVNTNETLSPGAALWDEALWDVSNWDSRNLRWVTRDQFRANSFGLLIETNDTNGPFRVAGIRLHGR